MATAFITEFDLPFSDKAKGLPMAYGVPLAKNNVTIGVGSAQSNAFSASVIGNTYTMIRVHAEAACGVEIGANPTATNGGGATASQRMVAGQTEYFYVKPGQKIAVIN